MPKPCKKCLRRICKQAAFSFEVLCIIMFNWSIMHWYDFFLKFIFWKRADLIKLKCAEMAQNSGVRPDLPTGDQNAIFTHPSKKKSIPRHFTSEEFALPGRGRLNICCRTKPLNIIFFRTVIISSRGHNWIKLKGVTTLFLTLLCYKFCLLRRKRCFHFGPSSLGFAHPQEPGLLTSSDLVLLTSVQVPI